MLFRCFDRLSKDKDNSKSQNKGKDKDNGKSKNKNKGKNNKDSQFDNAVEGRNKGSWFESDIDDEEEKYEKYENEG
ncbi:hypothetical protein TWF594_011226 [Orbilia oligospora]|uniref:Uncharacterized protein n=1 Tax=Orbilia oligospora TaxID=2813651 RepID=A0A7C8JTF7_ORBOL|nr:hypothetical protein TWF594_011226 [Orbilia oligospora]KAF3130631.1 hypothetical protein TWF703_008164 [Orbilia oligospora]